jgi:hypothetical protein
MHDADRHGLARRAGDLRRPVEPEELRAPLDDAHRREDGARVALFDAGVEGGGEPVEPSRFEVAQSFGFVFRDRVEPPEFALDVQIPFSPTRSGAARSVGRLRRRGGGRAPRELLDLLQAEDIHQRSLTSAKAPRKEHPITGLPPG